MDKSITTPIAITKYDDLVREKARLTELLKIQRGVIQRDIQALREELSPTIKVSNLISKFFIRENGNDAVVSAGTYLTIDILIARLFSKSNFILRLLLPALLKNLTSHYLPKAISVKRKITPEPVKPVKHQQVLIES